jgi:hypothetical protein
MTNIEQLIRILAPGYNWPLSFSGTLTAYSPDTWLVLQTNEPPKARKPDEIQPLPYAGIFTMYAWHVPACPLDGTH